MLHTITEEDIIQQNYDEAEQYLNEYGIVNFLKKYKGYNDLEIGKELEDFIFNIDEYQDKKELIEDAIL